jgi:hypothetical protein
MTDSPLEHAASMLVYLAALLGGAAVFCLVVVWWLRRRRLHWTWTAPTLAAACPLWAVDRFAAIGVAITGAVTTVTGARWHSDDLRAGGDLAAHARRRRTPRSVLGSARDGRRIRRGRVISDRGLVARRSARP